MLRLASVIFWFLFKLLLSVLFYATPVIGFWLVSSLAAYLGGPSWMAWTAGALLFPIIPGLWELHAWTHRNSKSKPLLTHVDRLSLRTFAVGLVFLVGLLCIYPQTSFVALSTRGDWMLDGIKDQRADRARHLLVTAAGGLQWLYDATKSNPYKQLIDQKAQLVADEATTQREQEVESTTSESNVDQQDAFLYHPPPLVKDDKTQDAQQEGDNTDSSQPEENKQLNKTVELAKADEVWPWKQTTLHPVVATMPASVETSIKSVAQYIAANEKDPVMRIKALHDYVADRVAYDSVSFYADVYPPQDAATVFKTRKSVCAGYANLLSALAEACNEKIIVVCGDARDMKSGDRLSGMGHAWNAARIKGRWYPIDACWDSGYITRETGFNKAYRTDYLLTPPSVMIEDHFPDQSTWQLLARPLSKSEFLRQPMLRPSFQGARLVLVSPNQARNETTSNAVAVIKNPKNQWMMAALESNGNQIGPTRNLTNDETIRVDFTLPDKGTYRINLFANEEQYEGDYELVGSLDYVCR